MFFDRSQRISGGYPDYSKKLRRLALTHTPVTYHKLKLALKLARSRIINTVPDTSSINKQKQPN